MAWWDPLVGATVGLVVLAALFVPIERRWPLRKRRLLRPMWRTDVAHFVFTGIMDTVFAFVGIVAAFLLVGWWAPEAITSAVGGQPVALQTVEVLLFGNVLGYWSHRLSHQVPLLWRFHKVHHSSQHLDWLAAARRHPLEQTWGGFFVGVPLIFFGFQPAQVAIVQILNVLWGIFLHANVRVRFRGLRQVIATPEFHHWHHSADPERYNTNYSLFPWLDRLFGTCHLPRLDASDARATEFGVPGYEPPGYLGQLWEPFRRKRGRLSRRARSDGWIDVDE